MPFIFEQINEKCFPAFINKCFHAGMPFILRLNVFMLVCLSYLNKLMRNVFLHSLISVFMLVCLSYLNKLMRTVFVL